MELREKPLMGREPNMVAHQRVGEKMGKPQNRRVLLRDEEGQGGCRCWVGAGSVLMTPARLLTCAVVWLFYPKKQTTDKEAKAESKTDKSEEKGEKQTKINFNFSPFCFLALF